MRVTRGDIDGFFAIALNNLVELLLIPALCIGLLGFSPAMVYGRLLPGIALSYLTGNLFYAWQARRLARKEGRDDVCALPYGINTPSLIAYVVLVMLPAKHLAQAQGAADPDRVAWQAGLVACLGSGLIELGGSVIAERIRRATPRAALLSSLSGAGIAFLTLNFLLSTYAHPVVGLATLGLVFLFYFGGYKPKGGIPAALVILAVGSALAWMTGLAPSGPRPAAALGLHLPVPVVGELLQGLLQGQLLPYLSVILPMGLLNLLASIQCIESAAAAGDSYSIPSSLAWNGLGTLAAAAFGSPFPMSIYLGHPAWKQMGARSAYSTFNGVFILGVCLTGSMALIAWAVPPDVGLAIIVWVGITIAVQAFEVTPRTHWPAVIVGMLPVILAWVTFSLKNTLRIAGYGATPGLVFSQELVERFHRAGVPIEGGFALEQGTFYCSLILASVTVFVVERRLLTAAAWSLAAAALSMLGLLHSWRFTDSDTISAMPLLDRLGAAASHPALFPAEAYALAYVILAGLLASARLFARPPEPGGA